MPGAVVVTPYSAIDRSIELASPESMFHVTDYYVVLTDLYHLVDTLIEDNRLGGEGRIEVKLLALFGGLAALEVLKDEIQRDLWMLEWLIDDCYKNLTCTQELQIEKIQKEFQNLYHGSSTFKTAADEKMVELGLQISVPAPPPGAQQIANTNEDVLVEAATDILEAISRYNEQNRLSDEYFRGFYAYLMRIPPQKSFYDSYPSLRVLASPSAALGRTAEAATAELRDVMFRYRLKPWRDMFCEERFSKRPLCVLDSELRLYASGVPVVPVEAIDVTKVRRPPSSGGGSNLDRPKLEVLR